MAAGTLYAKGPRSFRLARVPFKLLPEGVIGRRTEYSMSRTQRTSWPTVP